MKKMIPVLVAASIAAMSCSFAVSAATTTKHSFKHLTESTIVTQKVDINTADENVFASLKGIGAGKAKAIISYREKNGPFKSIDDLTKVKGIGEKTLARIRKNNPDRLAIH